jgi:hypothetical protein
VHGDLAMVKAMVAANNGMINIPMKINEIINESDISWKDKIIFLEEYYTKNGNLTESNSESDLEQFELLPGNTVEPIIGMTYIVMSLMLVSDRVIPFESPIVGKFISSDGEEMKFINMANKQVKVFPPSITKRVQSTTVTFVFDSINEYGKVGTLLDLRWDLQLPDIDVSLLDQ